MEAAVAAVIDRLLAFLAKRKESGKTKEKK